MTNSTWQLFDLVLRNTLLSVWRWPLLTVVTILAATVIWGLYLENARFANLLEASGINYLIYSAIHAVIFAPLMVAVIRSVLGNKIVYADLWNQNILVAMSASVFLLLVFRLAWEIFLKDPVASSVLHATNSEYPLILVYVAYMLPAALFDVMLLAIVLCFVLLLPRIALGEGASPFGAWRMLKGRVGMALKLGLLTVLPFYLGRYFLPGTFLHPVHGPLTHSWQGIYPWQFSWLDWAEMLLNNVLWAGWMILSAALSAIVYQAATDRSAATAP
jgi:hypothetical protein